MVNKDAPIILLMDVVRLFKILETQWWGCDFHGYKPADVRLRYIALNLEKRGYLARPDVNFKLTDKGRRFVQRWRGRVARFGCVSLAWAKNHEFILEGK